MAVGRPFKKGQSGNPNGARKKNTAVSDLAAKEAPEAFKGLVELSKTHPDARIRLDAYKYIIDRNMGKPAQSISAEVETKGTISLLIGTFAPPKAIDE